MSVEEALLGPELRDGAVWAAAVGFPVLAAGLAARLTRRPGSWPVAGWVLVVASIAALAGAGRAPGATVLLGLALLGLAGLLPLPWRLPALLPGTAALAAAVPAGSPVWTRILLAVACVLAGAAGPLMEGRHLPGVGPVLLAGTAIGAWACVPDVEQAGVVAGAAAVVAVLSLIVPLRLGSSGGPATAGLVLWAAAAGAAGRPAAFLGASAGLGLLVLGVVALPRAPTLRAAWVTAAGHAMLLVVTSRVAGLQSSPAVAAALAMSALLAAAGALIGVRVRRRPRHRRGRAAA